MGRAGVGRLEGMRECREALQELTRTVQRGVGKRSLRAPAAVFVASIRAAARIESGALRDSVVDADARAERGRPTRVLLATDPAAVPNEFGTSKMAARPFFRRGIDSARDSAAAAMAAALKAETDRAVERAAKRASKAGR